MDMLRGRDGPSICLYTLIFLNLFVSTCSSEQHDTAKGTEIISVRSIDNSGNEITKHDDIYPKTLNLLLFTSSGEFTLQLKRSHDNERGTALYHDHGIYTNSYFAEYTDEVQPRSTVLIRCTQNGPKCLLSGAFWKNGALFGLRPSTGEANHTANTHIATAIDPQFHRQYPSTRQMVLSLWENLKLFPASPPVTLLGDPKGSEKDPVERHVIDVMIFPDSTYQHFFQHEFDIDVSRDGLNGYLRTLISEIDDQFQSVFKYTKHMAVNVRMSSVFYAKYDFESPWSAPASEKYVTVGGYSTMVKFQNFLSLMSSVLDIPTPDYYIALTRNHFLEGTTAESSPVSYVLSGGAQMCAETTDAVCVVQDGFNTARAVTRCLAQSMGVVFEGGKELCIEARQPKLRDAKEFGGSRWALSSCTARTIRNFIKSLSPTENCLEDTRHRDIKVQRRWGGEVYSLEQQCTLAFGQSSHRCDEEDDAEVCSNGVSCFNPTTAQCYTLSVKSGTSCQGSERKMCYRGRCTSGIKFWTDRQGRRQPFYAQAGEEEEEEKEEEESEDSADKRHPTGLPRSSSSSVGTSTSSRATSPTSEVSTRSSSTTLRTSPTSEVSTSSTSLRTSPTSEVSTSSTSLRTSPTSEVSTSSTSLRTSPTSEVSTSSTSLRTSPTSEERTSEATSPTSELSTEPDRSTGPPSVPSSSELPPTFSPVTFETATSTDRPSPSSSFSPTTESSTSTTSSPSVSETTESSISTKSSNGTSPVTSPTTGSTETKSTEVSTLSTRTTSMPTGVTSMSTGVTSIPTRGTSMVTEIVTDGTSMATEIITGATSLATEIMTGGSSIISGVITEKTNVASKSTLFATRGSSLSFGVTSATGKVASSTSTTRSPLPS